MDLSDDKSDGILSGLAFHLLVEAFHTPALDDLRNLIRASGGQLSQFNDDLGIICVVASLTDCREHLKPTNKNSRDIYGPTDPIPGIHSDQQVITSTWISRAIAQSDIGLPDLEIGWNHKIKLASAPDRLKDTKSVTATIDQVQYDFVAGIMGTFDWNQDGGRRKDNGKGISSDHSEGVQGEVNSVIEESARSMEDNMETRGEPDCRNGDLARTRLAGKERSAELGTQLDGPAPNTTIESTTDSMQASPYQDDIYGNGKSNVDGSIHSIDRVGRERKRKREHKRGKADFYKHCDEMARIQGHEFNKRTESFYRNYQDMSNFLIPSSYKAGRRPHLFSGCRHGPIRRIHQAASPLDVWGASIELTTTALESISNGDSGPVCLPTWDRIPLGLGPTRTLSQPRSMGNKTGGITCETTALKTIIGHLHVTARLPNFGPKSESPPLSEMFLRRYLHGLCSATIPKPPEQLQDTTQGDPASIVSPLSNREACLLIPHVSRRHAKVVWVGAIYLSSRHPTLGIALGSWTGFSPADDSILWNDLSDHCKDYETLLICMDRINIISQPNILHTLYGIKSLFTGEVTPAELVLSTQPHLDTRSNSPGLNAQETSISFFNMSIDLSEYQDVTMAETVLDIWYEGSKAGSPGDAELEERHWFKTEES